MVKSEIIPWLHQDFVRSTYYWSGVGSGGEAEREFSADLMTEPGGRQIVKPELPHTEHWFDALCAKAKSWGADFVKIDNQGCQNYYREAGPIGKTARAVQTGIETAVAEQFDGAVINCMGMPSECMFNRPDSAVSRCSDDFQSFCEEIGAISMKKALRKCTPKGFFAIFSRLKCRFMLLSCRFFRRNSEG